MADQSKLKSLLDKINWLYKSFEEHDFENISSLETALLKEKVLMFYDEIDNITASVQNEKIIDKPVEEIKSGLLNKTEVKEIKKETIVKEPVQTELKKDVSNIVIEEKKESINIDRIVVNKPILNGVSKNDSSIKAKPMLTVKEKFEKSEAFNKQISIPKRDMREIIDLNKSFIFKAELFTQNNDLYNQFINEMNTTRTEDDAFSVLINWTEKLNWNTDENKAYDLLLRAVEKRFLPLI